MKRRTLVVAAVLVAGPVSAQDSRPDWIKRPTPNDLLGVWPKDALQKGVGGKALISCLVTVHGTLRNCVVVDESPEGSGFGAAAIAMTPQLLMKPALKGGKAVEATVRLPINFEGTGPALGSRIAGQQVLTRKVLSNVSWSIAPTYAEVVAAYPEKARAEGVSGKVTLTCAFKADGRVGGCMTLQEQPRGKGFGPAAKALAAKFVGPVTLPDGKATKGVDTQLNFVFASDMLDPSKRVIGRPDWAALPKTSDVEAGYPAEAVKARLPTARVVLACNVGESGRLEGCASEREDPAGYGFAESALKLSRVFQVRVWTAEGLPTVGGKIRVPIRYNLPEALEAPVTP